MIEAFIAQIYDYLLLTAGFFVVFFVAVLLLERCRIPVQAFFKKNFPTFIKIPDTLGKGFVIAVFIVISKKYIYHMPVVGMIQTTYSVWWADKGFLVIVYLAVVLWGVAIALLVIKTGWIKLKLTKTELKRFEKNIPGIIIIVLFVSGLIFLILTSRMPDITLWNFLLLLIFAPLIILKMLCTGKYLGLLTSFVVGVFSVKLYKNIRPTITKKANHLFIALVFGTFLFLIFSFFYFPREWDEGFFHTIQTAESESIVLDLLEASPTIQDERLRHKALEQILLQVKQGDVQWSEKIYEKMIAGARTIKIVYFKANLLQESAQLLALKGDISWALDTADAIEVPQVKFAALMKIFKTIPPKENPKLSKKILQQAIEPVYLIKPWQNKSNAFKEIALAAVEAGDMDLAKTIFQRALGSAVMIKNRETKCKTLMQLALDIAKTGNTQWAHEVAQLITDEKIRNKTRRKMQNPVE